MKEQEVFLVSEIGESRLGTVEEILHPEDPYADYLSFNSEITDLVHDLAFNEDRLEDKISVTLELRKPMES